MRTHAAQISFIESLQAHGLVLMRFGIGLVFVWFGSPKLVPGLSPAEDLVAATVTCCDPSWFVPTLGLVEILIGLCLWFRNLIPLGLLLMAGHMCGTLLPLFSLPEVTWQTFPIPTLEGQYIIKNVVLVAGAMVLAGSEPKRMASWLPAGIGGRSRRSGRRPGARRPRVNWESSRGIRKYDELFGEGLSPLRVASSRSLAVRAR